MKQIIPVTIVNGIASVDWNRSVADFEQDFDERPPTKEEHEMLMRIAWQEREIWPMTYQDGSHD